MYALVPITRQYVAGRDRGSRRCGLESVVLTGKSVDRCISCAAHGLEVVRGHQLHEVVGFGASGRLGRRITQVSSCRLSSRIRALRKRPSRMLPMEASTLSICLLNISSARPYMIAARPCTFRLA